jgi:manganese-dependent inorganic pyrophosphatase
MISHREVIKVRSTDTFLTAYRRMLNAEIRCVPVEDEQGDLCGILRYFDLLRLLLPGRYRGAQRAHRACIDRPPRRDPAGRKPRQWTAAAAGRGGPDPAGRRLLPEHRQRAPQKGHQRWQHHQFLVICGDRPIVQRYAIENGARALLVTGGNPVSQEIRQFAQSKGVILLRCAQDTASASTLIRCSRTVRHVMERVFSRPSTRRARLPAPQTLSSRGQDLFPVVDPGTGK